MSKKTLVVFVKDTGKGIENREIIKVFERFYREESTTKYQGTGLGLAIVKKLTELLNGTIDVKSVPDKGTLFTLRFPLSEYEEKTETKESDFRKDDYNWSGKTILIADDVKSTLDYYSGVLKKTGAKFLLARNGKEAIDIYKAHMDDIDLILMDLQMPIIDGFTATMEIRKSDPELPILAQTALAMPEDKQRALKSGHNECLFKPISLEKLYRTIDEYMH